MPSENHLVSSSTSGEHRVDRSVESNTEEIPSSSMAETGHSSDGPATPTLEQQQQQPDNISKRIPSYVFARTLTRKGHGHGHAEWSTCSNESLFSINSGKSSLTRDQMFSMKSGELSYSYDPTKDQLNMMKSGDFSYCDQLDMMKSVDLNQTTIENISQSGRSNEGCHNKVETKVAGRTRKKESQLHKDDVHQELSHIDSVIQISEAKKYQYHMSNNASPEISHSHTLSRNSDASVKSFAFPILTGNANKNGFSKRNTTKNKYQESEWSTPGTSPQITSGIGNEKNTPPESPEEEPPETPKEAMKSHSAKVNKDGGPSKWFACFSCCSSGS